MVPMVGGDHVTHNSTPKRDAPRCTVLHVCCSLLAPTSGLPRCSVSWGLDSKYEEESRETVKMNRHPSLVFINVFSGQFSSQNS